MNRLYWIGGKGGVGRSSVSAALALKEAKSGKKTLLVQLDTGGGLEVLFGKKRLLYEPTELAPNVYGTQWTPSEAQLEYGLMKLHSQTVYKLVFQNPLMEKLLDMVPSLSELLLLGKLWFTLEQVDDEGAPLWDAVIVDAPATGHSVSMLKVPGVIQAMMGAGPMADDARRIQEVLQDSTRTRLWLVTLAEELPVRETLSLYNANRDELGLQLESVVINQCLELSEEDYARADGVFRGKPEQPEKVRHAIDSLRTRMKRQAFYEAELRAEIEAPIRRVPLLVSDALRIPELQQMAAALK